MERSWAYFDTSAYLKVYVKESGSEKARKAFKTHTVLSSAILPLECFSALSRRRQSGDLSEIELLKLRGLVRTGVRSVEIIRVSDEVLAGAEAMTLRSAARALDAIHLASARLFKDRTDIDILFITSDKKQHDVALTEGFATLFIE
ncbi:MAG: type II toxin-antitoxin system VapC family toxin [Nitrospirota bacterium]